jgi:hypothetical protein
MSRSGAALPRGTPPPCPCLTQTPWTWRRVSPGLVTPLRPCPLCRALVCVCVCVWGGVEWLFGVPVSPVPAHPCVPCVHGCVCRAVCVVFWGAGVGWGADVWLGEAWGGWANPGRVHGLCSIALVKGTRTGPTAAPLRPWWPRVVHSCITTRVGPPCQVGTRTRPACTPHQPSWRR